jgi:membrane protein
MSKGLLAEAADAGRALRDDIRVIAAQFGRQDIFFHAGSVAYSALLALIPFALLLTSALGYVLGAAPMASSDQLGRFLGELLPDQAAQAAIPLVREILNSIEESRGKVGLIGLPFFVWFATRFFGALRGTISSIFVSEKGRGIIHGKLLDMAYVVLGTLVVTVYLVVVFALTTNLGAAILRTATWDPETLGLVEFVIGRVFSTAFLIMLFSSLYKYLPARYVHWESAIWGGVWGATLFELMRQIVFEVVARVMNPASIYSGTIAAIVIVVFWAYYAAVIFLIGGIVARVHEMRVGRKSGKFGSAEAAVSASLNTEVAPKL